MSSAAVVVSAVAFVPAAVVADAAIVRGALAALLLVAELEAA